MGVQGLFDVTVDVPVKLPGEAVLGVAGGVVICGRMILADVEQFVAAHYDRATRTVKLQVLGPASGESRWLNAPRLHSIAVKARKSDQTWTGTILDLAAQQKIPFSWEDQKQAGRWNDAVAGRGSSPHILATYSADGPQTLLDQSPFLVVSFNSLHVCGSQRTWEPYKPQRDGLPLLGGASVTQAQLAGDTLAVSVKRSGEQILLAIGREEQRTLGEASLPSATSMFALSPDGRHIAYLKPFRTIVAASVSDVNSPRAQMKPAVLHNGLTVRLIGSSPRS